VFIMRVRDGLIVESRDYIAHLAHVRAFANAERA
jgi:ketosteroid isomerase-like protein